MNIYLLHYEDGDYSDYTHVIVGAYATREKAEAALDAINQWKVDTQAYSDLKWSILKDQGYESLSWEHKQRTHKSYVEDNPQPKLGVHNLDGKELEWVPSLADWKITEMGVR